MRARSMGSAVAAALLVGLVASGLAAAGPPGHWTFAGQGYTNTRYQNSEHGLGVGNVAQLEKKWVFTTGGNVSATPAVDAQKVYVPDWAGNLYAIDRSTGTAVWSTTIGAATGIAGNKARATPAVADGKVFIGDQGPFGRGGRMLAFDANTGALLWTTVLDDHPAAIITQSAVVHAGVVYIGVASIEELFATAIPFYPCCSFRGSMLALDAETGTILWKTMIVPPGYPGGAVWGSSPALDLKRGQVYIGTGNNYDIPDSALACVAAAGNDPGAQQACIPADNYIDSIMALDMRTGAIKWATKALPFDAWTVQCIFDFWGGLNAGNCPQPAGPDFDFGQAPALFSVKGANGKEKELVGAGQKSGQYWALNPDTGQVQWVRQAGPGGTAGGLQWGSAVDGTRVYTANANSDGKSWTMPDNSVITSGVWSGLDAATGALLWQTAPPHGFGASGPVTTANGVVFGCALDPLGYMYALNAATGAVLWEYASGGSCLSGAAISNGTLYWGSGYTNLGPPGTPNNQLFAFGLP
jgi:polyvinyl alcohol dehydrogenase (cytochrome)